MRAARFHAYGEPLVIEDVPIPTVGPGQVLVKVAASANNPADAGIRAGALKAMLDLQLPHTPGIEVSGVVDSVADDVDRVQVGDAVIAFLPMAAPGAAAEYVVVAADLVVAAPASISLADAAALPATGLTAQQALFEHRELRAGERVLINGAGGAVGGYAVQLAVLAGAEVIATASPNSVERIASYRPAQVIDHTQASLRDSLEGQVDLLVNLAPTPTADLLPLIRRGGRLVSATGSVDEAADAGVTGLRMGVHPDRGQLVDLVAKVDAGELSVWVADRRPLDDINDVQSEQSGRRTILIP